MLARCPTCGNNLKDKSHECSKCGLPNAFERSREHCEDVVSNLPLYYPSFRHLFNHEGITLDGSYNPELFEVISRTIDSVVSGVTRQVPNKKGPPEDYPESYCKAEFKLRCRVCLQELGGLPLKNLKEMPKPGSSEEDQIKDFVFCFLADKPIKWEHQKFSNTWMTRAGSITIAIYKARFCEHQVFRATPCVFLFISQKKLKVYDCKHEDPRYRQRFRELLEKVCPHSA